MIKTLSKIYANYKVVHKWRRLGRLCELVDVLFFTTWCAAIGGVISDVMAGSYNVAVFDVAVLIVAIMAWVEIYAILPAVVDEIKQLKVDVIKK